MNKNWKSEIKWFVLSAIVAFSIFWLLIAQFQNYNWTLSPQYSDGLWNLGLVFYFLCLTAGLVYFIRFMFNGQRIRLIKILAVIFPGIGIFCFLRASWILKNLDTFLSPTSEKTESGFTIYPPLSYSNEQYEQLNELRELKYVTDGILILLVVILLTVLLVDWKRKKTAPNKGYNL